MSDSGDIVQRFKMEGIEESLSYLNQMREALSALNAGGGQAPSGGSGTRAPLSAAADAPQAPEPWGGNYSYRVGDFGHTPGSYLTGNAGGGGWSSPTSSASIIPAAPSPAGSYSTGSPGSSTNAGMFSTVNTIQIIAQQVHVAGPISGGGGGGGSPAPGILGGGGGGILGGGGGPGNIIPAAPPPGMDFSALRYLQAMMPGNPAVGAAANVTEMLGRFGPYIAGAGALYGAALAGTNAYIGYTEPTFQFERMLQSSQIGGMAPAAYLQPSMRAVAHQQGVMNAEDSMVGWLRYIPGGNLADASRRRRREQDLSDLQAEQQRIADATALGIYGFHGDLIPGVSPIQRSLAAAFSRYGDAAMGTLMPGNLLGMYNYGYSPEQIQGMSGVMASYAASPANVDLRAMLLSGNRAGLRTGTLARAAASGDFSAIGALLPNDADRNAAANVAWRSVDIANQQQLAGYGTQSAQALLSYLMGTGGTTSSVLGAFGGLSGALAGQRGALQAQMGLPGLSETVRTGLQASIDALTAQIGLLARQSADFGYGRRETALSAAATMAQVGLTGALYGGGGAGELGAAYGGQADVVRRQAQLMRDRASNPLIPAEERANYAAMATQLEQQASVLLPRQYSQTLLGISQGYAGVAGAAAGARGVQAALFGTSSDVRVAGVMQAGAIEQQIKALEEFLQRGNLSLQEQLNLQAQITTLRQQEVSTIERAFRAAAQQDISVAQGRYGIAATGMQTAFMRGVGGTAGIGLAFGALDASQQSVSAARAYVNMLRQRGVSEDNPELISARQNLAQLEQQTTGIEAGLGSTPVSIGLQREYSAATYRAQILQMMPGSYGNLRGALRTQMRDIEAMAGEKAAQYRAVVSRYGGEQNVPDFVRMGFQQEMQGLGLQEAQAFQQLSYGWESRLISQTIGTPGNFGYVANRFTLRDAVGAGVMNPHFGATRDQLPFFLQMAMGNFSPIGNTSTPTGFALTALAGARPRGGFGVGGLGASTMGGMWGADGDYSMSRHSGGGGEQVIRLEVTLRWPDGSTAGTFSKSIPRSSMSSLGGHEDLSNIVSSLMRGQ